jgi:hypothetical protein
VLVDVDVEADGEGEGERVAKTATPPSRQDLVGGSIDPQTIVGGLAAWRLGGVAMLATLSPAGAVIDHVDVNDNVYEFRSQLDSHVTPPDEQRDASEHEEHREEHPRDPRHARRDVAETEERCDDGEDEEECGPVRHGASFP